ncbi:MAG: hypothetical protein QME51_09830 [Planctomycetota bacterium]|nr:hypothetical protein [Planctomycetota bacterium]
MSAIIFPYVFYHGMYSPIIPIGVKSASGWGKLWAYIDSGSVYSIFRYEEAASLDINIESGEKKLVKVGDGDLISLYLHTLVLQISHQQFESNVGFSEGLKVGFNIIGRHGIFERFRICFNDSQHIVRLESNLK